MLLTISTASCSIRAATPRSKCPARPIPIPMPTGSTPRAKSWEFTPILSATFTVSCSIMAARRWAKRNPRVAGLTAAVLVLLASVAGVASVGYVRARAAEQELRQHLYASSINLMQHAWDTNHVSRLRALLAETEAYPD